MDLWMKPLHPGHGEIELFPLQFSVLLQTVLPDYPYSIKHGGEHQSLCLQGNLFGKQSHPQLPADPWSLLDTAVFSHETSFLFLIHSQKSWTGRTWSTWGSLDAGFFLSQSSLAGAGDSAPPQAMITESWNCLGWKRPRGSPWIQPRGGCTGAPTGSSAGGRGRRARS